MSVCGVCGGAVALSWRRVVCADLSLWCVVVSLCCFVVVRLCRCAVVFWC